MTTKRKSYSKQFKIDAVKLVTGQGYKISEAARNLDIHPNILRKRRCWYEKNLQKITQMMTLDEINVSRMKYLFPTIKYPKLNAAHQRKIQENSNKNRTSDQIN